jgi:apolipoprotein N-acyltransferase
VLDLAFPDAGIWPLIFPGLAMVLIGLIGRRAGSAYLVGFIAAESFYLVHIPWISKFLGSFPFPIDQVPLVALATFEAFFWGAGAILITLAYRWVPRAFPSFIGRIALLPVVVAGLWVLREAITSTWPWGGFSWGRLSFSQSESTLSGLFSWIGPTGVTFVIAALVASAIEACRLRALRPLQARPAGVFLTGTTIVVAAATLAVAMPAWQTATTGTMTVAAVQGNGKAGYFDGAQYGDLLRAQFDATQQLLAIDKKVDVIVWPEGGSDIDPLNTVDGANAFNTITREFDAPLVSGVITERDGVTYNSSVLWQNSHAEDIYDKRHPVPFGEYVPAREFFVPLAPDLLALIGRDYTPGTTDAVFDINGIIVGVNICFDIVDDMLLHDTVTQGAQLILAQSNNADFGLTDESVQQLAIARIRAMELGRSVVVNSTVGQSAIIAPDGTTIDSSPRYTADVMVDDVPLATGTTPATVIGQQLVWFLSALALAAMIIARLTSRLHPRNRRG